MYTAVTQQIPICLDCALACLGIFSFILCMIHAYETPPVGQHSLLWSVNGRDYHQAGTHSQARLGKKKKLNEMLGKRKRIT